MNTIPMTTTPPDPLSKIDKRRELERLLAEDSPQGEFLRKMRDTVRVKMFGLEPLCPDCQDSDPESPDSPESEDKELGS